MIYQNVHPYHNLPEDLAKYLRHEPDPNYIDSNKSEVDDNP